MAGKKVKLGSRLFGGFSVVLVLTAVIAVAGYGGLAGVTDRVEKKDHVNGLVKDLLETRLLEKGYIIASDDAYVKEVERKIKNIIAQATEAKRRFREKANKNQMDLIIKEVTLYLNTFNGYVELSLQKDKTMHEMEARAAEALALAETIRVDQKEQLNKGHQETEVFLGNKMVNANDADRIIKWYIEARMNEKEFLASNGEQKYKKAVDERIKKILKLSNDLKSRLDASTNRDQIDKVEAAVSAYSQALNKCEKLMHNQKALREDMRAKSQIAMEKLDAIRADQRSEIQKVLDNKDISRDEFGIFLNSRLGKADDANLMVKWFIDAQVKENEFFTSSGEIKFKDAVHAQIAKIIELSGQLASQLRLPKNRRQIKEAVAAVKSYELAFEKFVQQMQQLNEGIRTMEKRGSEALEQTEAIRTDQTSQLDETRHKNTSFMNQKMTNADDADQISKWFIDARKNEKEFIISGGQEKWRDQVKERISNILKVAELQKSRLHQLDNIAQMDQVIAAVKVYDQAFEKFGDLMREQKTADQKMLEVAKQAEKVFSDVMAQQKVKMESQIGSAKGLMVSVTVLCFVIGLLLSWLVTKSITRPLNKVIGGMNDVSDQVFSAAGQISAASQTLADGSSEQAASIEETSASLEEMASMTRQNAEHARQADDLMKESNQIVREADESMSKMNTSMTEISKASDDISKIIKMIDEIAFQTNLLALNAAVEAARAGQAGAGFAVVADEVRNLAMRAAKAAKNTAELIEANVKRVNAGSELLSKTNAAFKKVAESTVKVGEFVESIKTASEEQSRGIEQMNHAVMDMEKVAQQNAANAEESSSASVEMNSQAELIKRMVEELMVLIGGTNGLRKHSGAPAISEGEAMVVHRNDLKTASVRDVMVEEAFLDSADGDLAGGFPAR